MKTAVLIPCYNESKTIEKVVKDFKNILPNADIYVYDNNSTDMTAQIAQAAGVIVRSEKSREKGTLSALCFEILKRTVILWLMVMILIQLPSPFN